MNNFKKFSLLAKLFVLGLLAYAPAAMAATLSLSPQTQAVNVGDVFSVNILLDTQGAGVDGVDVASLRFNPQLLQVQNSGLQITPGSLMSNVTVNAADNSAGTITFSQIDSGGATFNGNGTLATVTFKALAAGSAAVTFDYTASSTVDSNVAAAGMDLLNGVTNGIYNIAAPASSGGGASSGGSSGGGGGGSSGGAGSSSSGSTSSGGTTSSGGGGGGYSGGGTINPPASGGSSSGTVTAPAVTSGTKLVNSNGTYYLISGGQRHGITNPGMLNSYGFSLSDAKLASSADLAVPEGALLLPGDGSLVKSREDQTVYLISNQQRYGFTSSQVFTGLGFKFSSVLVVTNPELQALPKTSNLDNKDAAHLSGVDINRGGTIYWVGGDNKLHGYPSLQVYNSWHIKSDFSRVVPANAADNSLVVGEAVGERLLN